MFSLTILTTLLAALSPLALTAPTPSDRSTTPLSISLSSDAYCSTLTSGTPTSLTPGVFYPVDSGISSMEIYAPPTQGTLTIYASANDTQDAATQSFSTEQRGCIRNFEFVGRGIVYTSPGA